jgi:monolysocardiolipin acyltransferase
MRNFLQLHTDLSVINRCHIPAYGFWPLFNSKVYHDIFKQLHTFPEGKIAQDDHPIRRLKWGTASLIVRAPITPIVLPIVHSGFEKVHGTDKTSC